VKGQNRFLPVVLPQSYFWNFSVIRRMSTYHLFLAEERQHLIKKSDHLCPTCKPTDAAQTDTTARTSIFSYLLVTWVTFSIPMTIAPAPLLREANRLSIFKRRLVQCFFSQAYWEQVKKDAGAQKKMLCGHQPLTSCCAHVRTCHELIVH